MVNRRNGNSAVSGKDPIPPRDMLGESTKQSQVQLGETNGCFFANLKNQISRCRSRRQGKSHMDVR